MQLIVTVCLFSFAIVVKVQFSMSSYQVRENDEYLLVQVTRMDDVVTPAGVTVTALSGTARKCLKEFTTNTAQTT